MAKSRLQPPIAKRTAPRTNPSAPTPVTTAPSRTRPFFPLQKPCPLWGLSHLPPFPPVFFAATSLWLATLCHLLRTHSLERQSQAYSRGTFFFFQLCLGDSGPWVPDFLSLFPTSLHHLHHVKGPVTSQGSMNSQVSNHSCFIPASWVPDTHQCTLHLPILLGP